MKLRSQATVAHFDSDLEKTSRTYLVLRAWFLKRSLRNGWIHQKAARRKWREQEIVDLKRRVLEVGGAPHTTGSKKADAKIRLWAPEVLSG